MSTDLFTELSELAALDAPTVMLIAHADEIGFPITGITPGGFLRITLLGGPTAMTLPVLPGRSSVARTHLHAIKPGNDVRLNML